MARLRRLQTSHRFEGARDGAALAGWLQLYGRTPVGLRVSRLVRDLQRLMGIWPDTPLKFRPVDLMRAATSGIQTLLSVWPDIAMRRKTATYPEIEQRMKERLATIGVPTSPTEMESWTIEHRKAASVRRRAQQELQVDPVYRKMKELELSINAQFNDLFEPPRFVGFTVQGGKKRTDFVRLPKDRFQEVGLIAEPVERLGQLGLLHRIRQCKFCGLWIFAKVEREQFCSTSCREKCFRTSDEGREKRRKYMQGYRARLRRMERNYLKASAKARR
jgi:hypothetical protein